jgi:hypothetical protein
MMFKPEFLLSSDDHLQEAMQNQTEVIVWQNGNIIDDGGTIERITDGAVWINGGCYLKIYCKFSVK